MTQKILVISDTQMPYDDRRALRSLIRCIGDYQPTSVIHIGDFLDLPTPARWSKGTAMEFAKMVRLDIKHAKERLLAPLREVYDGPVGVHEGNHDLRAREYLSKYAPALVEFENQFHIENLLDFDGFGIDLLDEFHTIAPGWVTTHGHRGQISLSRIAGNTALNAARKFGVSVIMGHTHRLGVSSHTEGYGGQAKRTLTGMEVGNLMDMRKAEYLKGGAGNWQQGFGLVTIEGQHVKAEVIPIHRGKFTIDGHVWELT